MKDVQCPYCGEHQGINHDDGYGYEEDRMHQQECRECGKIFVFTTSISFCYEARSAECLNGSKHKWKASHTFPVEFTEMVCTDCDERRKPTAEEWEQIKIRK